MKYYGLNTKFTFGKHQGKSLLEIAFYEPDFIDYCCTMLKHFCVDKETVEQLVGAIVNYNLSPEATSALERKWNREVQEVDAEISFLNAEFDDKDAQIDFQTRLNSQKEYRDEDIEDIVDEPDTQT